jgi:hypothetical protein
VILRAAADAGLDVTEQWRHADREFTCFICASARVPPAT